MRPDDLNPPSCKGDGTIPGYSTTRSRSIADATLASAFVACWCVGSKVETAGGVFHVREDEPAIGRLDTIPGVGRYVAEALVAEIGTDMSRFPSANHLASWAGMCPGNNESAGKRRSGKTRKGSPWLRSLLIPSASAICACVCSLPPTRP